MARDSERIAVTGIGVVTPIGIGKDPFWANLLRGESGIGRIQAFDPRPYEVEIGAEVRGFEPTPYVRRIRLDRVGRGSQLAIAAGRLALDDAGLPADNDSDESLGVVMGTTMGEPVVLETIDEEWLAGGPDQILPSRVGQYPCHMIASNMAAEFGAAGPTFMIPTACSAGNYAIGYATDLLRLGRATVVLAGGADCFSRIAVAGFARLAAIAKQVCQPFDKNRKGMVVGEGAGVLVLERLDHARRRDAPIYAEILGYGLACDAYHMTGSHPEGVGIIAAMRTALRESGIGPDRVSYISAHGTGTPTNDRVETHAIRQVFGEHAYKVPVSSIKSMIGHTMGAASAIEAAVCALAISHDTVPPTMNYSEPDPDCDLDYVPNQARQHRVDIALNNSAAFGGNNAALVLAKI